MSSSCDEGVWLTPLSTSRPTISNSEPGGKEGEKTSRACLTALSFGPRLLPMTMMILGILCLDSRPIVTVLHANFHGEFLEAEENSEGKWSGLSESNRHLNLGKVPYYHYTKAAKLHSFYNTPEGTATSPRRATP